MKRLTLSYQIDEFNYYVKFAYCDREMQKFTKTLSIDKSLNLENETKKRLDYYYGHHLDFKDTNIKFKERVKCVN